MPHPIGHMKGIDSRYFLINPCILLIFFLFLAAIPVYGDSQAEKGNPVDFTELSFEELMNVEIVTASRKPEKLSGIAAAVYVITREDIKRSGVTTIPDALRLAPGVQVARVNTHGWAISVRGFNDIYSNKLLVLIDGRSVYSSIYSGVFWDIQDTALRDIDRIEIIRGPGSTVWGANAVNGVINIITKKAKDTQGGSVSSMLATDESTAHEVRYGGTFGEKTTYRVFAKIFNHNSIDDTPNETSTESRASGRYSVESRNIMLEEARIDEWLAIRSGIRMDWNPTPADPVDFIGEVYWHRDYMETDVGEETSRETSRVDGGHLVTCWKHAFSDSSDSLFQFSFDRAKRRSQEAKYTVETMDFDFRYRFIPVKNHELSAGTGFRIISDSIDNFYSAEFHPDNRNQNLFSAFLQDQIQLIPDKLKLTVGSKFEHNEFTHFEIQPNVRLLWSLRKNHNFWCAVSRAVRTPARTERDASIVFNVEESGENSFTEYINKGNDDFESEKLLAWEAGYRTRLSSSSFLDIALFFNQYDDLKTIEYDGGYSVTYHSPDGSVEEDAFEIPGVRRIFFTSDNGMDGDTYGFEISASLKPTEFWRFKGSYSYLHMDLHLSGDSSDAESENMIEGSSPRHQVTVQSFLDIGRSMNLDVCLRYVDELQARKIPAYLVMDTRLAWRPIPRLELSLIGQDLFDNEHPEFSGLELNQRLYMNIVWHFN